MVRPPMIGFSYLVPNTSVPPKGRVIYSEGIVVTFKIYDEMKDDFH